MQMLPMQLQSVKFQNSSDVYCDFSYLFMHLRTSHQGIFKDFLRHFIFTQI